MPLQTIKCTDKILTDKDKDIITEEINAEYLKEFIYYIRGVRVMLDMDLAKIYGYSTKDFNRQVKNNIEKYLKLGRSQIQSIRLYGARNIYAYDSPERRLGNQAK